MLLRVFLFGVILGRMKILGEKSGETEVLMGVVGPGYFFLELTKIFSPQNWEKEN